MEIIDSDGFPELHNRTSQSHIDHGSPNDHMSTYSTATATVGSLKVVLMS